MTMCLTGLTLLILVGKVLGHIEMSIVVWTHKNHDSTVNENAWRDAHPSRDAPPGSFKIALLHHKT
ncbi:MAG: hypothetical protein NVS2B16_08620 [Chloroflexota bacterium]